ncbi:hypothetical protein [Flavobacterium sp. SM2513]|uniref:hypothetical protein n=1 Tax=Flavobacterium sp. SM2513 TaxID=3424766 RepID=UPI003D7FEED3
MKNKLYINFIILILSTSVFGQNKCFTIQDSITSTSISYANIWHNNKIYANSDANGEFCVKAVDLNGTFTISCVGYITKPFNLDLNTIRLEKDKINLEEVVVVVPKRKQKIKLGKTNPTNVLLTATYDLTISEIGKSFKLNNEKQLYLKEVKFKTSTYQHGRIMGLKIYSLNENEEPDQLLSTENIILNIEKGSTITTYAFEENIIPLPKNGFFVSLQMLLTEENKQYGVNNDLKDWYFYNPSIGANKGVENAFYFTKTVENIWKKIPNYDLNMKVLLTD